MLEKIPDGKELRTLMGEGAYNAWTAVCGLVDSLYEMDTLWDTGGKAWDYEYKYRRGGKTLCTLYARENCFGLLIIFGKHERAKFESERESYSPVIRELYDSSTTYHDGKWMMLELKDAAPLEDIKRMLQIKRRPNRK